MCQHGSRAHVGAPRPTSGDLRAWAPPCFDPFSQRLRCGGIYFLIYLQTEARSIPGPALTGLHSPRRAPPSLCRLTGPDSRHIATEPKHPCRRTHPLQVSSSMGVSEFTRLGNHRHHWVSEHFLHPVPVSTRLPAPRPPTTTKPSASMRFSSLNTLQKLNHSIMWPLASGFFVLAEYSWESLWGGSYFVPSV